MNSSATRYFVFVGLFVLGCIDRTVTSVNAADPDSIRLYFLTDDIESRTSTARRLVPDPAKQPPKMVGVALVYDRYSPRTAFQWEPTKNAQVRTIAVQLRIDVKHVNTHDRVGNTVFEIAARSKSNRKDALKESVPFDIKNFDDPAKGNFPVKMLLKSGNSKLVELPLDIPYECVLSSKFEEVHILAAWNLDRPIRLNRRRKLTVDFKGPAGCFGIVADGFETYIELSSAPVKQEFHQVRVLDR